VRANSFDASQATISGTNSSPWPTGTLTTTNANDILLTWIVDDVTNYTYTQPTSFTGIDGTGVGGTSEATPYQVVGSTQSSSYSWTGTPGTADAMTVGVIAFKAANDFRRPLIF
jgi:hypothetical protein